mmetsp:Transcript_26207/g.81677  ORF Transcript_26207/g.81677 Transcript_26207/m.81677 type:complete len:202 (-) Transcript_26207:1100-1705(-)
MLSSESGRRLSSSSEESSSSSGGRNERLAPNSAGCDGPDSGVMARATSFCIIFFVYSEMISTARCSMIPMYCRMLLSVTPWPVSIVMRLSVRPRLLGLPPPAPPPPASDFLPPCIWSAWILKKRFDTSFEIFATMRCASMQMSSYSSTDSRARSRWSCRSLITSARCCSSSPWSSWYFLICCSVFARTSSSFSMSWLTCWM